MCSQLTEDKYDYLPNNIIHAGLKSYALSVSK